VARLKNREWNGAVRGSERGEHWHPTQKSVEVMAWCLEQLGLPIGALVVDPFMGSGTTGLACLKTGRAFVGVEIDPRWYRASMRRLDAYLAQGQLL
jgi:site-specific DNA-methyltransferase (adenine-specific)